MPNIIGRLHGITIYSDASMVEVREIHRRERKWARRVQYQRWRRFDVTYAERPMQMIVQLGNALVAHPLMIDDLLNRIARGDY